MAVEIERKFMVSSNNWALYVKSSHRLIQGYICTNPEHTVRVRLFDDKAFLTLKNKTTKISRLEYEIQIEPKLAKELINTFCGRRLIDKTRHIAVFEGRTYEIDEYNGKLKGLIIAETELKTEDEKFNKPNWLGKEISGEIKFYNSSLVKFNSLKELINSN